MKTLQQSTIHLFSSMVTPPVFIEADGKQVSRASVHRNHGLLQASLPFNVFRSPDLFHTRWKELCKRHQ